MARVALTMMTACLVSCGSGNGTALPDTAHPKSATSGYSSDPVQPGRYFCTVLEKSSIGTTHLEGAPPPTASISAEVPIGFLVSITKVGDGDYRLVELPFDGSDRDQYEWHTPASVIHGTYKGNGESFASDRAGEEAFFVIGPSVHAEAERELAFYHSGFEWAGGEDPYLSIRWGRCSST